MSGLNTTYIGRQAETAASAYLEMRGYTIVERNYRRPRCEIDIIAQKGDTVYFVEVKYRRNEEQGGGFEVITASKLRQMAFGAEIWLQETKWPGPFQLAAVELGGKDFTVLGFIDNVYY